MTDFIDRDLRHFAEVAIRVVIDREGMTDLMQQEARATDAVREILGEVTTVHYTSTRIGDVSDDVAWSASSTRNFRRYMEEAERDLVPLTNHIGGVVTQTGGGCLAIELDLHEDYQVLVTDEDGPLELPTDEHTLEGRNYSIGIYAERGWVVFSGVTWKKLPKAVRIAQDFVDTGTEILGEQYFDTVEDMQEGYGL